MRHNHPAPAEWGKHHAFSSLLSNPGRIGTSLSGKRIFHCALIYLFISIELAFREFILILNQYTKLIHGSDPPEIFFFLKAGKLSLVNKV